MATGGADTRKIIFSSASTFGNSSMDWKNDIPRGFMNNTATDKMNDDSTGESSDEDTSDKMEDLGNAAQSFIQSYTVLHTTFTVQIATPGGKPLEFVKQDDQSRRWLNEFRMKSIAIPISLQTIDPHRYSCLLIPHSPGAVFDLSDDKDLCQILKNFIKEKKPICAIGLGVAALFSAMDKDKWDFAKYSLTSISIFELAKNNNFENIPLIPEDVIKDRLATYSCSEPGEVHVVIDRHLITGQNEQSTITAVQNLILLHNQKYNRKEKISHSSN